MENHDEPFDAGAPAGRAPGRSQAGPRALAGPHDVRIGPGADVTERQLIDFVVRESRLLDERRYEEWNALFTEDAYYWVPLVPDQEDGINHTSHLYEDKLLRELRIERLKSPRAHAQQPPTRSHHLLQTPTVESADAAANAYLVRTAFQYTESQGDDLNFFVGTFLHQLTVEGGALKITLKRVNLLNCDAALPAVQLFI